MTDQPMFQLPNGTLLDHRSVLSVRLRPEAAYTFPTVSHLPPAVLVDMLNGMISIIDMSDALDCADLVSALNGWLSECRGATWTWQPKSQMEGVK